MPKVPNQLAATDEVRLGWQSRAEMRRLMAKTSLESSSCEQNTTKICLGCRKLHSSKAKTKRSLYPPLNRLMSLVRAKHHHHHHHHHKNTLHCSAVPVRPSATTTTAQCPNLLFINPQELIDKRVDQSLMFKRRYYLPA